MMADHWTTNDIPDLAGKTALVTGANAGLGYEISKILADHGARVLLACRNADKAQAAATTIQEGNPKGSVEVRQVDLASMGSIDELAGKIIGEESSLDLLINNAGLMAVDEEKTQDGFEMQLGVNHLGHFVLTGGLMPLLLSTPGSRVVSMASMGHRAGWMNFDDLMFEKRSYNRWFAYFQSKLANILFTAELQRRLGPNAPTQALVAHPGASNTDLGMEGHGLTNKLVNIAVPRTTQSAALGALPAVRAAVDPTAKGGQFYGPQFLIVGKYPVVETPSRRGRNMGDARLLWEASEELTGRTIATSLPTN